MTIQGIKISLQKLRTLDGPLASRKVLSRSDRFIVPKKNNNFSALVNKETKTTIVSLQEEAKTYEC
ncbi:MAG TPA: hypothetical protein VEK06_04030, partial [Myxococcota bacterium]|nr:hypothetical protein [Myxococcota bacterium]